MVVEKLHCQKTGNSVEINYDRDQYLTEAGVSVIKNQYLREELNEESPQQAFGRAAMAFADNGDHAQRLYEYASNLWFMFATPLLSNGGTDSGLPISCFLSTVEDSIEDLVDTWKENAYLAVNGGGIGNDFSKVRSKGMSVSKGGTTPGVIPFIKNIDAQMSSFHQGMSRRGSAAIYLDINHPEIEEFVEIRDPISGDQNRRCLGIGFHHAVNIYDSFMEAVKNKQEYSLIDPHTKEVVGEVNAFDLWKSILKTRHATGEPYLHFIDTANDKLPEYLKDKGLRINSSNLCQEIELPTTKDRTAVCCLSSVNLDKYDEWAKDEETQRQFLEDLMRMLDNALNTFIAEAPKEMERAVKSVVHERSIGLGAMGFHSLLQKRNIPFESEEARQLNLSVFFEMEEIKDEVNKKLGNERASPVDLKGTGLRFAHTTAIAPNASSSIICGNTSPSIEPYNANVFKQSTVSGTKVFYNSNLKRLLEKYDMDREEVWESITVNRGSVQHLEFLTQRERDVFKTSFELDQMWVIQHAADRQKYIDQGQSVNVFIEHDAELNYINKIHFKAWKEGLKGLYYCRSRSPGKAEKKEPVHKVAGPEENKSKKQEFHCLGCEG